MALILVVDDDERVREVLELLLKQMGHDVLSCAEGSKATAMVDSAPVELVMTDILMPDVDGIEILRTLKHARPDLPVVVMSGGGIYDARVLLKTAGLLGAATTLAKPFQPADVERVVGEALNSRS